MSKIEINCTIKLTTCAGIQLSYQTCVQIVIYVSHHFADILIANKIPVELHACQFTSPQAPASLGGGPWRCALID